MREGRFLIISTYNLSINAYWLIEFRKDYEQYIPFLTKQNDKLCILFSKDNYVPLGATTYPKVREGIDSLVALWNLCHKKNACMVITDDKEQVTDELKDYSEQWVGCPGKGNV